MNKSTLDDRWQLYEFSMLEPCCYWLLAWFLSLVSTSHYSLSAWLLSMVSTSTSGSITLQVLHHSHPPSRNNDDNHHLLIIIPSTQYTYMMKPHSFPAQITALVLPSGTKSLWCDSMPTQAVRWQWVDCQQIPIYYEIAVSLEVEETNNDELSMVLRGLRLKWGEENSL